MSRLLSLMLVTSLLLLPCVTFAKPDQSQDANKLAERLKRLEQEEPKDIADPPFGQRAFPSRLKPLQEIIRDGNKPPVTSNLAGQMIFTEPICHQFHISRSYVTWYGLIEVVS
jgi:hypothetical protein